MRARSIVLSVVCGVLAVSGVAAEAAPKKQKPKPPVCNLVTDAKGDADDISAAEDVGPNSPALDILSADIATDATNITAVLRVDKLTKNDSTSPLGNAWYVYFSGNGPELYLSGVLTPTGESFSAGYVDTTRMSLGAATGVFDTDKSEIRVTAPLAIFAPQAVIKPGSKLSTLNALTQRYVGAAAAGFSRGVTLSADTAEGGKSYVAGSRSCVAVGK